MTEYIAYLINEDEEIIDQTSIDENSMELARDLFIEFGYELDGLTIEIEPV